MQHWLINEAEAELLLHMPHRAQVLYVMELRRYMDYATGLVGMARKISLRGMAEALEVRPERGSTEPEFRPTTHQVRAVLDQLERVGLVARVSGGERFAPVVFRLPLASTGLNRPQEEPQMNRMEGAASEELEENTIKTGTFDNCATTAAANEPHGMNRIHQEVIINSKSTSVDLEPRTAPALSRYPNCPHDKILDLWQQHLPSVAQPLRSQWSADRKGYKDLAARWREGFVTQRIDGKGVRYETAEQGLQWWARLFAAIARQEFLTDKFKAFRLDWLVNKSNFIKVLEGAYRERAA